MMTGWFPAGVAPAHDGCYIVRRPKSECWFFCRWCGVTGQWFSAGSTGTSQSDVIGWSSNAQTYEWRGLKENGEMILTDAEQLRKELNELRERVARLEQVTYAPKLFGPAPGVVPPNLQPPFTITCASTKEKV